LPPTGIKGANQTIFMRRIALRPPISFFGQPTFVSSRKPTALERFRATVARKQDWWGDGKTVAIIKQDWWGGEEKELTPSQSLPAAASGASESADIEEGSDSEDNRESPDEE
jgi:hypothetical protein